MHEGDVRFAGAGAGGRVHVLNPTGTPAAWLGRDQPIGPGEAVHRGLLGVTYCGQTIELLRGGDGISDFDDGLLCARCHQLFPDDKTRLFEHGTATDDVEGD